MSLDPVAQFLYPNDAPVTYKLVCGGADGNCFLRAVAMSLTKKEENHKQLRQQVAEQLCNKPQAIAAALIEKCSSCLGVNPSSLIATFLSDESYSVFKAVKEVEKGTEDSLALAVVKEGNETKKFGS